MNEEYRDMVLATGQVIGVLFALLSYSVVGPWAWLMLPGAALIYAWSNWRYRKSLVGNVTHFCTNDKFVPGLIKDCEKCSDDLDWRSK